MPDTARNSLEDLERYRLQLETNLKKLRKALQHWQTWEADYEILQEEIQGLDGDASGDALIKAAKGAEGELVNAKEIEALLGQDKQPQRSATQVIALISRRIEYVHKNVETLQKQTDAAEEQLASVSFVIQPEATTEEGLPVTEIYEELDEDGNVISGRTSHPGDVASEVLDILEKAGVKEEDFRPENHVNGTAHPTREPLAIATNSDDDNYDAVSSSFSSSRAGAAQNVIETATRPRRKSVSFAEGTKEPHDDGRQTATSHSIQYPDITSQEPASTIHDLLKPKNLGNATEEEPTDLSSNTPVIPPDESPEDAAIRREMLQYHMSEIGSIVAQLDLDEGEDSNSDYDDEEGSMLDSASGTDEEDQYGLSMNRGINDKYVADMMNLEKKLGAQMFQNIGPKGSVPIDEAQSADSISYHQGLVENQNPGIEKIESVPKEKTVRFADKLDVAPPHTALRAKSEPGREIVAPPPISESIVERPITKLPTAAAPPQPSKPSRFKSARMAAAPPTSASDSSRMDSATPSTTPLASRIVEHPPLVPDPTARPPSPDEFDPALLRQQVATEYYRQRNRMIQKEGGFSRQRLEEQNMEDWEDGDVGGPGNDDEEDSEMYDEEEEQPKPEKVSLFKAARLKKAGLR